MNPGAMANAASSAGNAASAAGNAASSATSAASNATSAASSAASSASVPQQPKAGTNTAVPGSSKSTTPDVENPDSEEAESSKFDKIKNAAEMSDELLGGGDNNGGQAPGAGEGLQPGDKVAPGKKIGEDGQVEDSSTAKTLKAAGRVAARVYGSDAGGQAADAVINSKLGDKAIGVVSDVADKNPGVSKATELLDKSGVADGVNDALDTYEKAKSGDIKGALESAKKAKKDFKKTKRTIMMFMLIGTLPVLTLMLIFIIVVAVAAQSMNHEAKTSTESLYENMYEYTWPADTENGSGEGGGGDAGSSNSGTTVGEAAGVAKNQRMSWLFPNGTPTSPEQMAQYLTKITVPIWTGSENSTMIINIHSKLAPLYRKIFEEMAAIKFPVDPTCTAGYNWRKMSTNANKQSYHSYGSVIDLNWKYNPLVYGTGNPYLGKSDYVITQRVVNIWKKYGFYWGGAWTSYQDYMHFTYTNN